MLLYIQNRPCSCCYPCLLWAGVFSLTESPWWFPPYVFSLTSKTISLSWSRRSWGSVKASKKSSKCTKKLCLLHTVFSRSVIFHLSQLSENLSDLRALGGYDRKISSQKSKYYSVLFQKKTSWRPGLLRTLHGVLNLQSS